MKPEDLEKFLENSGISTLDTEIKQQLFLFNLFVTLHSNTGNNTLRQTIDTYFIKTINNFNNTLDNGTKPK